MNRAARSVLRKLGTDLSLDAEQEQRLSREAEENRAREQQRRQAPSEGGLDGVPEELLTESELRHEKYRRRQSMAGRFTPAAERLPIMTAEEREERDRDRPKWRATSFEGPLEKLIEKYGPDLIEVQRHLTLGQSMKYEFTDDGKILDREGNTIYDGEKLVDISS